MLWLLKVKSTKKHLGIGFTTLWPYSFLGIESIAGFWGVSESWILSRLWMRKKTIIWRWKYLYEIFIATYICLVLYLPIFCSVRRERLFQNICPPLLQMSLWVACLLSAPPPLPRKMALTLRSSPRLTNVLFSSILGGHQGQKNLFLKIDSTEGSGQKTTRGQQTK